MAFNIASWANKKSKTPKPPAEVDDEHHEVDEEDEDAEEEEEETEEEEGMEGKVKPKFPPNKFAAFIKKKRGE